jgi:putative SOS response-associated peptidase YedK
VPHYNIAPTQDISVVRQHAEEPKRLGSQMRWGLIPFWAKDASRDFASTSVRRRTCPFREVSQ